MGLFDFLKRAPRSARDPKAQWISDKIAEAARSRDALGLAGACAALTQGGMVFGMVYGDLAECAKLHDEAVAALRPLVPTMPGAVAERVVELLERARSPIDVSEWRARIDGERRAETESRVTAMRAAIETASAAQLAAAWRTLGGGRGVALGCEVPADAAVCEALQAAALERLRSQIDDLPDEECDEVFNLIRYARLPVDITARRERLLADRAQHRTEALRSALDSEPPDRELERAIAADLDDAGAFTVYADLLQQRGHARGELIALQLRAESDRSLEPAVREYLDRHVDALLGPLAPHRRVHDGSERDAFVWRRGFIDEARLSNDDNAELARISLADLLALVLEHPSARLLRKLSLGFDGDYSDMSLDDAIDVLVRHAPRHLRDLTLGDFTREQCEVSWFTVGDVAPLWAGLPELRDLVVHGGTFELGTIDHPNLETAQFWTGSLSGANARAIASARWPRLQFLDVWYGDPNYGAEATIDDVVPLLARTDLPALFHLGLMNAAFTDAICARIGGSALAPQLRELDLSLGTMTDAGVDALIAAAPKLSRLEALDVSENYLGTDAIARLRAVYPFVVADDQRDDDDDARYPAVGE